MATPLRFIRGMIYPYTAGTNGTSEFIKFIYELWGYCLNGTSALQTPGGMANTMSVSYAVSNVTGAGVSPIVVTTTTTHALASGQQVILSGVLGATAANGQFQITFINTTQFSLNGTTGNGAYTGGGTINTTSLGFPMVFTEGSSVLAIGNDGYTAAQISNVTTGDAIFQANTNQPFSGTASTLTINQSTNYQTTIAAGSNGASLPQAIINVAATTTASTTIAVASNGVSLPTATINVASTTGFPSGGYLNVVTTEGTWLVTYTGITATTFTGCSGGIGSMTTGGAVTIGFPASGIINVTTGAGIQTVNYTGITSNTFTGCTGGTGTMSTGGAIYAPIQITTSASNTYPNLGSVVVNGVLGNTTSNGTWTVTTPTYNLNNALYFGTNIAFPSNGASLPQATINSITTAPFTTTTSVQTLPQITIPVAATAAASNTVAAGSNNVTLPNATVNVASTTGFPTSGTINVSTTASTTVALGSNAQALPQSTLFVGSTNGFPTTGTIGVATTNSTTITSASNGAVLPQATINVAATGPAATTIAAGSNGAILPQATINVADTTGFPTTGTLNVTTSSGVQTVTYTGLTGTTFTGCSGGVGTMSTGGAVNNTGFFVSYPASGTIYITTSTGAQLVTYTGTTATTFTGASGGTGTMSTGGAVNSTVAYTGITGTTFTGCTGGLGTMTTGNSISGGPFAQILTYTGVTGTSFTGCVGGFGTMFTGNAVNNTGYFIAFPTAGTTYINTTTGAQLVTYTGVTATSLTGCTGGSGNTSIGGSTFTAFSPASAYTSTTGAQSLPTGTLNVSATTTASTTIAAGSNGLTLPQTTISAASVSGFPPSGTLYITTSLGVQVVSYSGLSTGSFTGFTGCSGGIGVMSTGGAIRAGFPSSGYIYVTSSLGFQVVTYTGITGTTFTGCTGGTGTVPAGNGVFIGCAPTGTINVTTATGVYPVTYTGTTATTFTGGSGGSGAMSTGASIAGPITAITSRAHTLLYGQQIISAGIGGLTNANSTFTVTPISNTIVAFNSSLGAGAYTVDGSIVDHANFYLNTSRPNGTWTSGGTQQALVSNMAGKLLVMWKPGSQSSEDALYVITSVIGNNQLKINLNTGGTPDPVNLHPSFTERSNINYRIVDAGGAFNGAGFADGNFITLQFNPSAVGLNPGQANSQVQLAYRTSGNIGVTLSPGGNWNGITFPVTGNYQIDAPPQFLSQSGGVYNGTPNGNVAITMACDPSFFLMHHKDINSGDGSSYIHVEIPTRLYSAAADTNPMACLYRGGVFNGSVFGISGTSGANFGRGFVMKGTDNVIRAHYSLAKSLSGDASPVFGVNLTDFRIAFNTSRGSVLASDIILSLPGVTNQYSLGRARIRSIKFTSTPLPLYHRFGIPGGQQFLNIQNGVAIIWDNTILPSNLIYIL